MTTYRNIHGRSIRAVTTDPTAEVSEGEIWYNTGSDTFKSIVTLEAWSSGSPMIRTTSTAGANHALGAGIQTAAIYAGGYSPYTNKTEHYNGTGWTSGGNMNLTRITTGFGTETAAVAAGGITFPGVVGGQVEEYDGSSWTTGNALGTARPYGSGSGTLTAGLYAGGSPNGSAATSVANSEEYNGTNWSEGNDLNTARRFLGSAATAPQTAALVFGGDNAPSPGTVRSFTETYDGTSWTEVGDLNTARRNMGGAGDFTSALAFGGSLGPPGNSTATESWDGSSWSTSPASLANARDSQPSIGTSTAALFVGGPNPTFPGGWVEEYNKSANVITGAAWAAGGNLNTARQSAASSVQGTINASAFFGGFIAPPAPSGNSALTENYNGTTWTVSGVLGTARRALAGAGTQTAAIATGGYNESAGNKQNKTEEYDGSSWTAGNAMSVSRYTHGQGGTQTASWVAGDSPAITTTEEYDGTNWTSGGALNNARASTKGAGTLTAGIIAGSEPSNESKTEHYNGTSWTAANDMNTGRRNNDLFGLQTAAIVAGGIATPGTANLATTEQYNGTTWFTQASMSTAKQVSRGAGSTSAGFTAGGGAPSSTNATEEFTGETSAVNVKTLTQS